MQKAIFESQATLQDICKGMTRVIEMLEMNEGNIPQLRKQKTWRNLSNRNV